MKEPFSFIYDNRLDKLSEYLEHENVNIVDEENKSLLLHAIKVKDKEAFELLIQHYIDTELPDDRGNTSFHYTVMYHCLSFLRVLFLKGGNPMLKNKAGQTPLYMACRYGDEKIIDLYLEKYALDMGDKDKDDQTLSMAFTYAKNPKLLEKYKGYEPYLEEENHLGDTPLLLAVKLDSIGMVDFYLSKGAFINHRNHLKESVLFYAVRNENKAMIKLLMQHGAFLDFKNMFLETIFTIAKPHILEYIKELQAYEPYSTYERNYPLHYAIYMNDISMANRYLTLSYAFLEDSYGLLPSVLAEKYKNKAIIKKIKSLEREAKIATFRTKL